MSSTDHRVPSAQCGATDTARRRHDRLRSLAGGPFGSSLALLGTARLRYTFRVKARLRPPCCGNSAACGVVVKACAFRLGRTFSGSRSLPVPDDAAGASSQRPVERRQRLRGAERQRAVAGRERSCEEVSREEAGKSRERDSANVRPGRKAHAAGVPLACRRGGTDAETLRSWQQRNLADHLGRSKGRDGIVEHVFL